MKLWVDHKAIEPYAYALDETHARIILKVQRRAVKGVTLHFDDRYQQTLKHNVEMTLTGHDLSWDYFESTVEIPTRRLKYAFELHTKTGSTWYGEAGFGDSEPESGVFQLSYLLKRDIFEVPDWVNSAVCYQIFPERFANGNPALTPANHVEWDTEPTATSMHGGDLEGIRQHLGDLQKLGVNLIYLTPIFRAMSNHKYDTADYYEIDPQFGTKDDLKTLVIDAHARGIRIVIDAVFNHSGGKFGPFLDVIEKGRESKHWDWFFIEGDHVDLENVNYETFANKVATMPKLNVANPEVEEYLLGVAQYWIREFGVDGWRLDVSNEIDHVFWRKFRNAVKEVKPDALIIGEVWHNSLPWLRGDEYDGVMNYLFREYTHRLFIKKQYDAETFAAKMTELLYTYPEQATRAMFNLLGSHDTDRVLTLANGDADAVALSFAIQFLYPGIPMLYYGDEIGMEGGFDPLCRRGMVWDESLQNLELKSLVQNLAHLKVMEPALHGTQIRFDVKSKTSLVVTRGAGAEKVHALFNLGDKPVSLPKNADILIRYKNADRQGVAPNGFVIWKSKSE